MGGDCIPTHGHRGLQPMDTLHSITPLYFATIPRNIVFCLTLIQLRTYSFIAVLHSLASKLQIRFEIHFGTFSLFLELHVSTLHI